MLVSVKICYQKFGRISTGERGGKSKPNRCKPSSVCEIGKNRFHPQASRNITTIEAGSGLLKGNDSSTGIRGVERLTEGTALNKVEKVLAGRRRLLIKELTG